MLVVGRHDRGPGRVDLPGWHAVQLWQAGPRILPTEDETCRRPSPRVPPLRMESTRRAARSRVERTERGVRMRVTRTVPARTVEAPSRERDRLGRRTPRGRPRAAVSPSTSAAYVGSTGPGPPPHVYAPAMSRPFISSRRRSDGWARRTPRGDAARRRSVPDRRFTERYGRVGCRGGRTRPGTPWSRPSSVRRDHPRDHRRTHRALQALVDRRPAPSSAAGVGERASR